jgi:hypothetical protein
MDNGENIENARYAMNDGTTGFINQMKNRNTSTKTHSKFTVAILM